MSNDEELRPEDVEVKLPPLLGIDPVTYVPIVYGVFLLVILFLVLVLPGIRHHGSMVTVVSTPPRASVNVDGRRMGTSGETFFVPSGSREIEVRRPGFAPWTESIEIPGRLVGSWVFPRRRTVTATLSGAEPAQLVEAALVEFSDWSLTGEASGQYQFPPVARALAGDLAGHPRTADADAAWEDFAAASLPHLASEAQINDLLAASLSYPGDGAVAVPVGIADTVQRLARTSASAPLFPLQLSSALAAERESVVAQSDWVSGAAKRAGLLADLAFEGSPAVAGARRSYALGLGFVELPGGDVVLGGEERASRGGDIPYRVSIDPFAVGATEVPYSAYREFLAANPRWRPENRSALVAQGLVDEDYLAEFDAGETDPSLPVTGVSAYAAEAFAAWYTGLLPQGLLARLASEAEWSFALRASLAADGILAGASVSGPVPVGEAGGAAGIVGMIGNVWEWTADPFATYAHVHPDAPKLPAAHRVVRGGAWVTEPIGFRPGDRGSLDPAWCSPFVGFRLVVSVSPSPAGE